MELEQFIENLEHTINEERKKDPLLLPIQLEAKRFYFRQEGGIGNFLQANTQIWLIDKEPKCIVAYKHQFLASQTPLEDAYKFCDNQVIFEIIKLLYYNNYFKELIYGKTME